MRLAQAASAYQTSGPLLTISRHPLVSHLSKDPAPPVYAAMTKALALFVPRSRLVNLKLQGLQRQSIARSWV